MAKERDKSSPDTGSNGAGRVELDDRGRNVWHWNGEQLDSTTIMLSRLDNDALELEPTRSVPIPGKGRSGRRAADGDADIEATLNVEGGGTGFDPYNRS